MTPGLPLSRCTGCGIGFFPHRLICPRCGGAAWKADRVDTGVVEQMTTVRYAAGRDQWEPRYIACVRTSEGQVINAGLEEPLPEQTAVKLFDRDGCPIARRASA